MKMQLEADDGSRYVVILCELQLVLIDCVHSEDVVTLLSLARQGLGGQEQKDRRFS
jgi:hypothetical protein